MPNVSLALKCRWMFQNPTVWVGGTCRSESSEARKVCFSDTLPISDLKVSFPRLFCNTISFRSTDERSKTIMYFIPNNPNVILPLEGARRTISISQAYCLYASVLHPHKSPLSCNRLTMVDQCWSIFVAHRLSLRTFVRHWNQS